MTRVRRMAVVVVVVLTFGVVAALGSGDPNTSPARSYQASALEPVTDVHGLMEYVVEGNFETLKTSLKTEPADRKAWRNVYCLSTLLAESGNLLLMRKLEDAESKDWTDLSVNLRKSGNDLMKAAKAKDFASSRRAYLSVVNSCNQCHAKYGDDGDPKIEP